jgi:aspartate kinase
MVAASGEQVSVALTALALQEAGIPARSMLAMQAGIATDDHFTSAHIQAVDPAPLQRLLAAGIVPVVAGFQGVTPSGELTTLGRGGSDITAVAIAAALKADACYIYTDVDGVYSTDPRICRSARFIPQLCHEEMLEMASLGAKVLHTRSVYFAMRYRVPLVVLSTFAPGRGTWIVDEDALMEAPVISGITHRQDEAKLSVLGLRQGVRGFQILFSELGAAGIPVDMITQTGFSGGQTSVSFTVPDELSSQALLLVQQLVPKLGADGASLDRDVAKVSVVGVGMRYHTDVAHRIFDALADASIEVQMIATSEIKVSLLVPRKYCEAAVRALHHAFLPLSVEGEELPVFEAPRTGSLPGTAR